jgi:hypothetical protein
MVVPGVNGSIIANTNAPTGSRLKGAYKNAKKFAKGGKASDDKEMVNGVASILRRVKDPKNRLQLANQLSKQFNREKVKYDLASFLNKSKVKK